MTEVEPENTPVTLEEMLACREERQHLQQVILARHKRPIVSLTIVMPGAIKDTATSRYLFHLAVSNFNALCDWHEWHILERSNKLAITGAEVIIAIDAPAEELKQRLVELEDMHPLGRFWDFDVLSPANAAVLSRSQFGMPGRKCLVCDEPAFVCGRSRRHNIQELQRSIEDKVNTFRCL